jgi:hypothetical protein
MNHSIAIEVRENEVCKYGRSFGVMPRGSRHSPESVMRGLLTVMRAMAQHSGTRKALNDRVRVGMHERRQYE